MEHRRVDETGFRNSGSETDVTSSQPTDDTDNPAKRVVLAGIGAVATAFDLTEQTFDQFVTRGERFQHELQAKAEDVRRQNAGTRYRIRDAFRAGMDVFLDGLNVPNKADVDTINVKLNILTRKIDDLRGQQVHDEAAAPSAPPHSPTTGDLAT